MPESNRKKTVENLTQKLGKADLFIHFLTALKTESYYYASILRDEIRNRHFSTAEIKAIKQSQIYPQLNGIFDE